MKVLIVIVLLLPICSCDASGIENKISDLVNEIEKILEANVTFPFEFPSAEVTTTVADSNVIETTGTTVYDYCKNFCQYNTKKKRFKRRCSQTKKMVRCLYCRVDYKCKLSKEILL